jgi:hypothetical protein
MQLHTSKGRVFIATTTGGISRAVEQLDGSWHVQHLLTDYDVRCLASSPLAPGRVYAGTRGQGVLRSVEGCENWIPAGMEGSIVTCLAVSTHEPSTVYAGTKPPAVFVSHDGGSRWEDLSGFRRIPSRRFWFSPAERPFSAYVQGIALSPTEAGTMLVGIEAGAVVRSADGGATWSAHRRRASRDCHSLIFHASDGNWAYEGGGTGPAISLDSGETWTRPREGLDRRYGWAVAADPLNPRTWYVSSSPGAMKAHRDGSANAYIFRSTEKNGWEKLAGGLPEPIQHMPYALVTDHSAGHLYAGLSNGEIWHTADHGETWTQLPFRLPGIHRALILLPSAP